MFLSGGRIFALWVCGQGYESVYGFVMMCAKRLEMGHHVILERCLVGNWELGVFSFKDVFPILFSIAELNKNCALIQKWGFGRIVIGCGLLFGEGTYSFGKRR